MRGTTVYSRILVAIDASPDSPDDSLRRTTQFARMTGGTVHLLHVARAHTIPTDIVVLGYQHHRGSKVAEQVIRQQPRCSVLLARPPT